MKRLEVIGEAANQITDEFRALHSQIPWPLIVGMRHRLIHEYFNIDLAKVWDAAQNDVPKLIRQIEPLVPPDEG